MGGWGGVGDGGHNRNEIEWTPHKQTKTTRAVQSPKMHACECIAHRTQGIHMQRAYGMRHTCMGLQRCLSVDRSKGAATSDVYTADVPHDVSSIHEQHSRKTQHVCDPHATHNGMDAK